MQTSHTRSRELVLQTSYHGSVVKRVTHACLHLGHMASKAQIVQHPPPPAPTWTLPKARGMSNQSVNPNSILLLHWKVDMHGEFPWPCGRPNTVSLYVRRARTTGLTSLGDGHFVSSFCFAHRRDTTTGNSGVLEQAVRRPKAWTNTCILESTVQMPSEVQQLPLSTPRRGTDLFSHGS